MLGSPIKALKRFADQCMVALSSLDWSMSMSVSMWCHRTPKCGRILWSDPLSRFAFLLLEESCLGSGIYGFETLSKFWHRRIREESFNILHLGTIIVLCQKPGTMAKKNCPEIIEDLRSSIYRLTSEWRNLPDRKVTVWTFWLQTLVYAWVSCCCCQGRKCWG